MLPLLKFTETCLKTQAVFPKPVPVCGGTKESPKHPSVGEPNRAVLGRGKQHGSGAQQKEGACSDVKARATWTLSETPGDARPLLFENFKLMKEAKMNGQQGAVPCQVRWGGGYLMQKSNKEPKGPQEAQ